MMYVGGSKRPGASGLAGDTISELKGFLRTHVWLLLVIGLFSVFVGILMLTGSIYMLQVYDRVLASGNVSTLLVLTLLVAFLYGCMGVLDFVRGRLGARLGSRFQGWFDDRVFRASLASARRTGAPSTGLQDIGAVRKFMGAPVFLGLFDLPISPLFFAALFIFHPWLGWFAVGGALVLIAVTLLNKRITKAPLEQSSQAERVADRTASELQAEADLIRTLGMTNDVFARWKRQREDALDVSTYGADWLARFSSLTKTLRLFLQSAILGLAAYLVIQGKLSPGAMIAGSILMGRALAPIELLLNQWQSVVGAWQGWHRLETLLDAEPEEAERMPLPQPTAALEVIDMAVVPPGAAKPTLMGLNFNVEPGQALGVVGASGSGKSSLAKALVGLWSAARGEITLDGAKLGHYDPDRLGKVIGYLPQAVHLFNGTIAENIARMAPEIDSARVVEAAKQADVHALILSLPDGYDTRVNSAQLNLSGGQVQRIGLARALYHDPVLLVLDEPNSALDHAGSMALNHVIDRLKAKGRAVVIMAHRPTAIQRCEMLLVLDKGQQKAFGPAKNIVPQLIKSDATPQPVAATQDGERA